MINTVTELTWLTLFILKDLHIPLSSPPILYYDNPIAMYMMINPVFYVYSKHIKLDYHFMHVQVAFVVLITQSISTNNQVDNIFT